MKLQTNNYDYEFQIESDIHCLLDCKHCSSLMLRSQSMKPTFYNAFFKICNSLDKYKILVNFTGGEPLYELNFLNFVQPVSSLDNFSFGLFTSGIQNGFQPISRNYIKELKRNRFQLFYISLYSNKHHIHDTIVGKRGAFLTTIESIRRLKSNKFTIVIHLVLTKFLIDSIDEVIYSLYNLSIDSIRVLPIVKAGSAVKYWQQIGMKLETENYLIEQISKHKDFGKKIFIAGRPDTFPCRNVIGAKGCQAGFRLAYIDGMGNIWPCASLKGISKHFIAHISQTEKFISYVKNNIDKSYAKCIRYLT